MEIFAGLSVCLLMLAALAVVTRTFALWLRTRGVPELLLSLYLAGATLLGYPLLIAANQIPANEMWALHVAGQWATIVGFTSLLLFTCTVFRPDALWARVLVGCCMASFAAACVTYFREVTGPNPRPTAELLGINMLTTVPVGVAYFWTTVESLRYHRQLRRRLRLGLADAAVVDRVLLWGLMTLAAGAAVVISVVGMAAGIFMTPSLVVVLSSLGLVHAGCLFLAFHPPRWYVAWLDRRHAAEIR
jgi:hypothetical protein